MSGRFEGGTRQDGKKYLVVKAGPHRDVRVATLVLEAKLGRKLKPDEDCHHLDSNTLNMGECGSNLVALGKADHGAVSNRQRWFLANRELHERKQWEQWINEGGDKPDESNGSAAGDGRDNPDANQ